MKRKFHKKFNEDLNKPIDNYNEAVNVHQIEELANRKFSKQAYTYYSVGSLSNESLDNNENAFKRYKIIPKTFVNVSSKLDASVELLGEKIDFPICIAPTAMHKLAHFNGEKETAKAANELNTIMCLSTISNISLTEVAKHTNKRWMQFYCPKDLNIAEKNIKMIEKNGYSTLVITVDTPALGIRDLENFGKFEGPHGRKSTTSTKDVESGLGQFFNRTFNDSLTWDIIPWFRKITKMKLVLKGIHRPDDAIRAIEAGIDGIIVSNHGGRQMDCTPGGIDMLALIMQTLKNKKIENQIEVYLDGGIRRGTDVFKALALGAKAVFIGRPVLWGLGSGGKDGIIKVFELVKREFLNCMILAGTSNCKEITSDFLKTNEDLPKF